MQLLVVSRGGNLAGCSGGMERYLGVEVAVILRL